MEIWQSWKSLFLQHLLFHCFCPAFKIVLGWQKFADSHILALSKEWTYAIIDNMMLQRAFDASNYTKFLEEEKSDIS